MKGCLRVLLIFLLVVVLLVGGIAGYVIYKLSLIDYNEGEVPVISTEEGGTVPAGEEFEEAEVDYSGLQEMETFPVIPEAEVRQDDDIVNILLLGTDSYSGKLVENARSDCMILVSINKNKNTVKLVSLERGMGVYMPYGMMEGQYDLLTHAFRWGGSSLVCDCVENHLRVQVDHYVRVSFDTVTAVVDAIGGIDMELTGEEAWELYRHEHPAHEGMNHMDGRTALAFARMRAIDSDWQRVERQRKVILAAVEALKGSSLMELNNLLDQILPLIQTNLTMLEIADLMLYAPNFLESTFDQMTIPVAGTYGFKDGIKGFAVDYETNSQILIDFLYGTGED
jgi:LCP family protein required for cell wall assembly